jgi:protocatechuate 3,4-dioxygenase beta subunit
MEDGAKTKIYGLLALVVLALGLAWWLQRDGEASATDHAAGTKASAEADAVAPGPVAAPRRGSDVDPWKAARAVVTGTVRDEAGQPIAGAQVCAKLQDRELAPIERHPPRCVTTREDGSYRIDELLGAEHHLFASAHGYLPLRYEARSGIQQQLGPRMDLRAGATREGIDFVLKAGGVEVQGVVKDLAGGEIEGAWVSSGGGWWSDGGASFTRSGEDGRFSLWVEPPEVSISAFAEGYAAGSREAAVPGTFVEVLLTPESVVVGKVVWAGTQEPVAGAQVSTGISTVHSEDDGSFRLEGLSPGAYKVSVIGDELTGLAAQKVHVGLGQTSEPVVVQVHRAFAVRGTVLVDGKTPCSFGRVTLTDESRKSEPTHGNAAREDGSVLVKGVLPGTYEVTVACNGYVSEDEYPSLVVADASHEGLSWSVSSGRIIRGTVVDAAGKPVHDAYVSARAKADKAPRARRSNAWGQRTEADGGFVVEGLLPGTYELSVSHDDLPSPDEPIVVELPAGTDVSDVTLTLPASGEIRGIVRDDRGEPVADVSVRLRGARWGGGARTNDEGRFIVEGVAVGEYRITAQRGWTDTIRAPGQSDDDTAGERVEVRAGEVAEVALVVESQNGRITGRVVDEGGEPVADAFVSATRESDSAAATQGSGRGRARWSSWGRKPVLTDDDGRFELPELAEQGRYTIHATRKGGGEALAEQVAVGSEVELAIGATGVLAGMVVLEGGGAPRRFQISASDRTTGVRENDRFLLTDGKWRLESLPPGTYEVAVDASEGNAKLTVELAEGAERTDLELVLTPRITVRGRLVDGQTGEPVAGLKVSVRGEAGGMRFGDMGKADQPDISDAQGNVVVEDAPTGKVSLMITPPGFTENDYGWTWIPRRLPPEPSEQDLGDIELFKDRVGPGKEAGDIGFKVKEREPGIEPEDARQVVAFVRPGGPAAAAGLAVGDEIVAVDGKPVTGTDAHRFDKLVRVLPGTKVILGLAGDRSLELTAGPPV